MQDYDWKSFTFGLGQHETRDDGMCVMEAVAYVAGEEHTDHPACASPVISAFLRIWNDSIPDDARRTDLLHQFVWRLPGTAATKEIEMQRSYMAFDWMVREFTPIFLEMVSSLSESAKNLRALPEIVDKESANKTKAIITAARDAAWDALHDTVRQSQESAVRLLDRMIRLTEIEEKVPVTNREVSRV